MAVNETVPKMAESEINEETSTNGQNHWAISRVPKRRNKATPRKRSLTASSTANSHHTRRRRPNMEERQSSPSLLSSVLSGHIAVPQSGWVTQQGGEGVETVDQLRAELEWYKKENMELRKKLDASLNITELEKTLRMTLHSFGVPVPASSAAPESQAARACNGSEAILKQKQKRSKRKQMTLSTNKDEDLIAEPDMDCNYQTRPSQRPDMTAVSPGSNDNGGCLQIANTTSISQEMFHSLSQVELIPGSNILVDSNKLSSIAFKKDWSYTLLTRNLMPMVFSRDDMATSCVRGERATGKGRETSPARPALERAKVQAIISFVSSQFPNIQPYQITQTMNQKLVDVRGTNSRRKRAFKLSRRR